MKMIFSIHLTKSQKKVIAFEKLQRKNLIELGHLTDSKIFQKLKIHIFLLESEKLDFEKDHRNAEATGLNETNRSEGKRYFGGLKEVERIGLTAVEFESFFRDFKICSATDIRKESTL